MLLAIDIGNSHIVLGEFRGDELLRQVRIPTEQVSSYDELESHMSQFQHVAIASVVPRLGACLPEPWRRQVRWISCEMFAKMPMQVDCLKEVGVDRLINAYTAYQKHQKALIIVDMGTATKFDVVNADGVFLGGAIAPGFQLSGDALFERASHLPKISANAPKCVIGKNTHDALQSGWVLGYVGLVDALVIRMKQALGSDAMVLATGGVSPLIKPLSRTIDEIDVDLTLTGIQMIYREWERM